ncbi:YhbY family RNA-binding protein [Candidatus Bathyarchaeota archaeon]|nr:YhbY family RNA-binding protein [Candidatus Bathyarchaeota archaeon]
MPELRRGQTLSDGQGEAEEKRSRHRLKRRSSLIKPKIWIGRAGVTEDFIHQLDGQLKASRLVKVKVQQTVAGGRDINEISKAVASTTGSSLVDVRGNTFTLWRDSRLRKRSPTQAEV